MGEESGMNSLRKGGALGVALHLEAMAMFCQRLTSSREVLPSELKGDRKALKRGDPSLHLKS